MKRVISLFLTMLLVLGTVILPVSAEEVSYPDFQFAAALGFLDGENLYPDEAITRAQLAQMFHNIVFYNNGAESNIVHNKQDSEYAFTDVKEEQKDAVKLVSDMGIMTGFPDGTFRPDAEVTYHQLVKTFVTFLGYDVPAKELGGWTVGYLTQANRLGVLPGGNIAGDAIATCGAAAQMLKLATGADVMLTTNGVAKVLKGVNYLEHWCKIEMKRGKVTGNYLTNTSSDDETSYFGIYLDDTYMNVAASAAGVQDKLGYQLAVYYKEVNGSDTVLYFEEEENNNVLNIEADELVSASTSQVIYTKDEGEHTQRVNLVKNATVIYNGSYLDSYTDADLNPFKEVAMDGSIRLIDNNTDGSYDMVVVDAYDIYVVSAVSNGKIYNAYKPKEVVDISKYEERNINIINILGEPVTPESIKAGQVINVLKDKNGVVKSIMASKDVVTGSIEMVKTTGSQVTSIRLSGTDFDVLPKAVTLNSGKPLEAGVQATVYFGKSGKIAYIDVDGNVNDGYQRAVMIDMASEGVFTETVSARIFAQDGQLKTIQFPQKMEINGDYTKCDESTLLTKFGFGSDNKVIRQVFLYKLNEAGDTFTSIRIADKSGKFSDGFYQFPKGDGSEGDDYEYSFKPLFKTFDDLFAIDENTIVFAMPSERYNWEDYSIASLDSKEEGSKSIKAECYGTGKEGVLADVVLINESAATSQNSSYNPIFMVRDVIETRNEEGKLITQISGIYVEGSTLKEGSFDITKELMLEKFGSVPNKGDVYRLTSFANTGKIEKFGTNINDFIDLFDFKTKKFNDGGANPRADGSHTYRYGTVTHKIGNVIKMEHANEEKSSAVILTTASYFKIIEVKTDQDGDFVSAKQATASCIIAENDCPGAGSKILTYNRGAGIAIFVFN